MIAVGHGERGPASQILALQISARKVILWVESHLGMRINVARTLGYVEPLIFLRMKN